MGLGAQDIATCWCAWTYLPFTIANDESYFYPDMLHGMVLDKNRSMRQDIGNLHSLHHW